MSTRCQIGFYRNKSDDLKNPEALIYRHQDGYPEGVVPDLLRILGDFDKKRGLSDIEYASAWLVRELKDDMLNIGISKQFHLDIEYYYAVYPSHFDVYQVSFTKIYETDDINESVTHLKTEKF